MYKGSNQCTREVIMYTFSCFPCAMSLVSTKDFAYKFLEVFDKIFNSNNFLTFSH